MRQICLLFLFSLLLCGEISCKSVTQTIPAERSKSEKTKRQLFKFTPLQALWLDEYPVIQKEVEGIIKKEKESITKDAEELFQEFPTTALLPYELEVKESKLFKHDKQDIVSVRMAIRIDTGGAHGNKFYYSWNWDRQKNTFISLNEVITPEQFQSLIKQVRRILFERRVLLKRQKQNDEYDKDLKSWIEAGTSKEEDFKIWNFDQDGIVLTFPEYQVGPFTAGSFEVFVSLKSL